MFHYRHVIMEKNTLRMESCLKFCKIAVMKNMQKMNEDSEENCIQVSEETDDETEASALQKEEDSQKDKDFHL